MEKRSGTDRRKLDLGPPAGCCERRKTPDRRLLVAEEAELSEEDFAKLFGGMTAATGNPPDALEVEHAAEVLERARDRF